MDFPRSSLDLLRSELHVINYMNKGNIIFSINVASSVRQVGTKERIIFRGRDAERDEPATALSELVKPRRNHAPRIM